MLLKNGLRNGRGAGLLFSDDAMRLGESEYQENSSDGDGQRPRRSNERHERKRCEGYLRRSFFGSAQFMSAVEDMPSQKW